MKNKDLIRILQALEPEDNVTFQLGRTEDEIQTIAKAAVIEPCVLNVLTIDKIEILQDSDFTNIWACIVLDSSENVYQIATNFDKEYKKIKDAE